MPQPYNLTSVQGSTSIWQLVSGADTLAGGALGVVILLLLYVLFFFAFKRYETKGAILATSFIVAIGALFMRLMGLLSDQLMFATFLIAGFALVWARFSD